jgi:hypothetical protein
MLTFRKYTKVNMSDANSNPMKDDMALPLPEYVPPRPYDGDEEGLG